jgi:hypothetical protein
MSSMERFFQVSSSRYLQSTTGNKLEQGDASFDGWCSSGDDVAELGSTGAEDEMQCLEVDCWLVSRRMMMQRDLRRNLLHRLSCSCQEVSKTMTRDEFFSEER